jgi:hypothetical protein
MKTEHDFTINIGTQNYNIKLSPSTRWGWFEHKEFGDESGGGLWFNDLMMLEDYDGVFMLPTEVKDSLVKFGHIEPHESELW